MFRLAHVTDPHFRSTGAARLRPGDFLGKRAIGALNLVVNRVRKHRMELLADLARGSARPPGRSPGAHRRHRQRRARIGVAGGPALDRGAGRGRPTPITVIPGNHDAYVPEVVEAGHLRDHCSRPTSATSPTPRGRATIPSSACAARWRWSAVNSCVATGDLGAWGEIGPASWRASRPC